MRINDFDSSTKTDYPCVWNKSRFEARVKNNKLSDLVICERKAGEGPPLASTEDLESISKLMSQYAHPDSTFAKHNINK